jgi:hypothetical protein
MKHRYLIALAILALCALALAFSAHAQSTLQDIFQWPAPVPNNNLTNQDKWTPTLDEWNKIVTSKQDSVGGGLPSCSASTPTGTVCVNSSGFLTVEQ